MKTYQIIIDDAELNDFQRGRISGIIYCLTGMPEVMCAWYRTSGDNGYEIPYHATEEQHRQVVDVIAKSFPGVVAYEGEIVE